MDSDLNKNLQSANPYGIGAGAATTLATRNRVLRNTYWLLALSLIPTVIGAWAGIAFNVAGVMGARPGMTLIVFLVGAFGLMFAIQKYKDSGVGVALLLAFTFFMGLMLSRLIGFVLGFANGTGLIMTAFAGTGLIFLGMASLSTVIKRDLTSMGKFLFIGMVLLIVASIANLFFQVPAVSVAISAISVMIFSAYLLYDLSNIIRGGETNYIMATLGLFLSLYNIFVSLLNLLMFFSGQRD